MVLLEVEFPEQSVTYEMLYPVISLNTLVLVGVQVTVMLVIVTVLTDTSLTCSGAKYIKIIAGALVLLLYYVFST